MGRKKSYFRRPPALPIAVQGAGLKRLIPDSSLVLNKNVSLKWEGEIQPSIASDLYTVQIKYKLFERPKSFVINPPLLKRDGKRAPHIFSDNSLCLFRYKYYEWNSRMPLAETILPWSSLWLLHYEIWLVTGIWHGSIQEHPESTTLKEPETSSDEGDK